MSDGGRKDCWAGISGKRCGRGAVTGGWESRICFCSPITGSGPVSPSQLCLAWPCSAGGGVGVGGREARMLSPVLKVPSSPPLSLRAPRPLSPGQRPRVTVDSHARIVLGQTWTSCPYVSITLPPRNEGKSLVLVLEITDPQLQFVCRASLLSILESSPVQERKIFQKTRSVMRIKRILGSKERSF